MLQARDDSVLRLQRDVQEQKASKRRLRATLAEKEDSIQKLAADLRAAALGAGFLGQGSPGTASVGRTALGLASSSSDSRNVQEAESLIRRLQAEKPKLLARYAEVEAERSAAQRRVKEQDAVIERLRADLAGQKLGNRAG